MRTVRVLEAAAAEAAEAAVWYEARGTWSRVPLGVQVRSRWAAEGILRGTPWLGRPGEHGVTRLLMQRFPFSVVFVTAGEGITVLALAHHRRKSGCWRDRLDSAKGR